MKTVSVVLRWLFVSVLVLRLIMPEVQAQGLAKPEGPMVLGVGWYQFLQIDRVTEASVGCRSNDKVAIFVGDQSRFGLSAAARHGCA